MSAESGDDFAGRSSPEALRSANSDLYLSFHIPGLSPVDRWIRGWMLQILCTRSSVKFVPLAIVRVERYWRLGSGPLVFFWSHVNTRRLWYLRRPIRAIQTLSVVAELSEVAGLVERARSTFLSGDVRHAVLVDLPPGPPPVMADRRRIVQVLSNLLTNAARHAPESTPIRVAAVREDAHVAVSVSDRGAGWRPNCCRTCSASTLAQGEVRRRASDSPSVRARRGARRPHPGREPRPWHDGHLHDARGRGGLRRPASPSSRRRPPNPVSRRVSSWSTTTRGCCAADLSG